jgi:hypothetical protein
MAKTAIQEEQGVSSDIFRLANFETARYRFYFLLPTRRFEMFLMLGMPTVLIDIHSSIRCNTRNG